MSNASRESDHSGVRGGQCGRRRERIDAGQSDHVDHHSRTVEELECEQIHVHRSNLEQLKVIVAFLKSFCTILMFSSRCQHVESHTPAVLMTTSILPAVFVIIFNVSEGKLHF